MFIIKFARNILILYFIFYVYLDSKEISKDDFIFLTNKIVKETKWQDWIYFDCLNPERTFPEAAKIIINKYGYDYYNFVKFFKESRKVTHNPKKLQRKGFEYNAAGGDFSPCSDVYPLEGMRISPGGSDGWVEYRILIGTDTNKAVILEFIWTDNAWFSGIKKCYLYNWTKNVYEEVWFSKENKGKEQNTRIFIKKKFINKLDGTILIKFIATSISVMHIKEIKLNIIQK